jgi:hypothetical protein
MKKLFLLSFALMMIMSSVSGYAENAKKPKTKSSAKVEVYYFHFTRRCMTCNAVEAESKKAIEAAYPALVKSGKITFKSLNLDDQSSKPLAEKCGAEGQALLVMGGGKRFDLTSQGFQYAKNDPEKLKAELRKTIDPLVKK